MTAEVTTFELRPATLDDLPRLHAWMNDPAVARYWELAGPIDRVERHLTEQLSSAHSTAYVGWLADEPMSYWELYRADLDPLAAYYPARPYDGGIHLLLGPAEHRGRGLGARLLTVVSDGMFAADPRTTRVVAEPDVTNVASVRAFARAGFSQQGELRLPDKLAALMVRERL